MPALHNTPEPLATGAWLTPRRVWLLPEGPPASVAARILAAWREAWPAEAPWLLLAPEARAAAWADALRDAWMAAPSVAFSADALRRSVRAAVGAGAALICGGLPADEEEGRVRPALFVHAPPSAALLRAWSSPAPVIGLAAREPHEPLDRPLLILTDFPA